jgi:hypothetical protein
MGQRPFILFLVCAGVLRLVIAWAPLEWLLQYVLSDDAFYYFTIARNAAHGYGLTFDKLAETNGFHPLWMAVLLPVYAALEDQTFAIHVILTISALVDVGSLCILNSLLRGIQVSQFTRWNALLLFSLAPALVSHTGSLNGMETGLNVLLIILYLATYQRVYSKPNLNLKDAVRFGIVSGLLFLVRTDNVILLGATYVQLAIARKPKAISFRGLAIPGIIAFAIAIPWLWWCYTRFGTLIQVSGVSLGYIMKTLLHESGWLWTDYVLQYVRNLANAVTFFPVYLHDTRIISFSSGVAFALLTALLGGTIRVIWRQNNEERVFLWIRYRWLAAPVVAAGLFVLVHTWRAVYIRGWYYASIIPVLLVALAVLIDQWTQGQRNMGRRNALKRKLVIVGGMLLVFSLSTFRIFTSRYGEIDKMAMVKVMNKVLSAGSRVGSWNAGLYGYYFEKGEIVNLDGLVNNEAYKHIVNRSLESYCREKEITYLVDPVGSFVFARPFWRNGQGSIFDSFHPVDSVYGMKEHDWIVLGRLSN